MISSGRIPALRRVESTVRLAQSPDACFLTFHGFLALVADDRVDDEGRRPSPATQATAMTPRFMRYPWSGSLRFGLALGQVGEDFRAAVGCGQAAEKKAKVDHPLQFLP